MSCEKEEKLVQSRISTTTRLLRIIRGQSLRYPNQLPHQQLYPLWKMKNTDKEQTFQIPPIQIGPVQTAAKNTPC
jgi:hypothetical protein